jgi:6-pyruvoyltetrahydropterin/6-carboxytetrahydropterin synthase
MAGIASHHGGQAIVVRHNIEVAHRLSLLPGKCENVHGHSMWVELSLAAPVNTAGIVGGLDFGAVKRSFRGYLDDRYDHHLLLNARDELVGAKIPGTVACDGDPTTENIARWVGEWALDAFVAGTPIVEQWGVEVRVNETHVNAATWRWCP